MELKELVDGWQTLLDKCPPKSRGWLLNRVELVRQYRTPQNIYLIQAPDNDNDFRQTHIRNESVLSDVSAMALYNYACERLMTIADGIQQLWDCELLRDDQGTFIASFYTPYGGRLTVHGIKMTKNWCGVVSDQGVIVQC